MRLRIMALIALLPLAACTCKQKAFQLGRSSTDNTLRISITDDIKTMDPANLYDGISLPVMLNVFEPLFQYHYLSEQYRLIPLLAADMPTYSKDQLTVTIRIKTGVRFQDDPAFKATRGKGREVVAEDFVYQLKRLALPSVESAGWWILDGKIAGINAFRKSLMGKKDEELAAAFGIEIEGIQATDSHTLKFKLTKPYPQLPYVLAMAFAAPVAREVVEAYADEKGRISDRAVGTGPYFVSRWERSRKIVLDRNPTYHPEFYPTEGDVKFRNTGMLVDAGKTLPFIDRLEFQINQEPIPAWLKFLKSELDITGVDKDNTQQAIVNDVNLSPEMIAKGIRLNVDPGISFFYIVFNMRDPLLGKNKYLRQALASAINRDQWIDIFFNGRGKKQTTLLNPGIPGRPEESRLKYDFNIARAKELLKQAGYPGGKGLPVLQFDTRSSDSFSRQAGEFFEKQFAAIGVKLRVNLNTLPAYLDKTQRNSLQIHYGAWNLDYPDAENGYQLFYGPNVPPGPNDSAFDHAEFNKIFEKMAVMEPSRKRSELIHKLDDIIQEECPIAYGFYLSTYRLSQPWITNIREARMIRNRYKYLKIDQDIKKRYLDRAEN